MRAANKNDNLNRPKIITWDPARKQFYTRNLLLLKKYVLGVT
jgi:hypothetical protein